MSMNRVEITGRLPRDPELSFVGKSGIALCKFTVAVRDAHWTPDKDEHVVTHWIAVLVWGELGEAVGERYRQGDELYVLGELVQEEIQKAEGKTEKKTRVRAIQVTGVRKGRPQEDPGKPF